MAEKEQDISAEEIVENDAVTEETMEKEPEKVEENEEQEAVSPALEKVEEELAAVTKEKEQIYDRLLRIQAEYDNFKKRTQKEKAAERKYRSQELATELLPALDNFERALQADEGNDALKGFLDGMSMIYRQLIDVLEAQGISKIETVGKEFDPNLHHAVMQVEDTTKDSNVIVEELQKGYILEDRVIRPAMVKVNK